MSDEADLRLRLFEARCQAARVVAERIAAGDPLEEVLHTLANLARALHGRSPPHFAMTEAERAAVGVRPAGAWLLTADRSELMLRGGVDFPPEQKNMRIPANHGLPGLATQSGQPLLVTNTDNDPRFVQIISTGRVGSTLQIPVKVEGESIGIVFVAAMAKDTYWPDDFESMKLFAALAAAAVRAAGRYN